MSKKRKSFGERVVATSFLALMIIILICVYGIYKQNNFNDFYKAEYKLNLSEFKRDNQVKIGEHDSYRISSNQYFNDAIVYKNVEVEKNTPYKVSCMVKTEGVITEKEYSLAGAQICIADTAECSKSITGTKDWQKLEFYFNSKNRDSVNIRI